MHRTQRGPFALAAALIFALPHLAFAQANNDAAKTADAQQESDADVRIVTTSIENRSKAELTQDAWSLLDDALKDPKWPAVRTQGVAALAILGRDPHATTRLREAMQDKDLDVRQAAMIAAGQTKNTALIPDIRRLLDDKEADVQFRAALTLAKLGDHSGDALLAEVAAGQKTGKDSLLHGSLHDANRELHNPGGMALMGVETVGGMFLGPFGYGIAALEYAHKNGGDSARVQAIATVSEQHTPSVRAMLLEDLGDKDAGTRAAAAKGLVWSHDLETQKSIALLFADKKRPVQLTAAAAYLIAAGVVAQPATAPAPARSGRKHP